VNQYGTLHRSGADGSGNLHAQRPSAFVAVSDRLRQGEAFEYAQGRSHASIRPH
jgi:hypothetical protein